MNGLIRGVAPLELVRRIMALGYKGSAPKEPIIRMRRLFAAANLAPLAFESHGSDSRFSARLLLQHFLSKDDLKWLEYYAKFDLNDNQKRALIFVREVGAIDNPTYRQMSDTDYMKSTTELRTLRELKLLKQKVKGRGIYYIAGSLLITQGDGLITQAETLITQGEGLTTHGKSLISQGSDPITHGKHVKDTLPDDLQLGVNQIGVRTSDKKVLKDGIVKLCKWIELKASELFNILNKDEKHLRREYLKPLIDQGRLQYRHPDMIKHPDQAYKAINE